MKHGWETPHTNKVSGLVEGARDATGRCDPDNAPVHPANAYLLLCSVLSLVQPFGLVPVRIEILGVLRQQPARALEHSLVQYTCLALEVAPEARELVVHELNCVKAVVDQDGAGTFSDWMESCNSASPPGALKTRHCMRASMKVRSRNLNSTGGKPPAPPGSPCLSGAALPPLPLADSPCSNRWNGTPHRTGVARATRNPR